MKAFIVICLLSLSFLVSAGTWDNNQSLFYGVNRYFDVYVPDTAQPDSPLVIVLHGGTGNKTSAQTNVQSPWVSRSDEHGFVLVYPNGTRSDGTSGRYGSFNWNDCRIEAGSSTTNADDVGFINALIDEIHSLEGIDLSRVYVTGVSNGGLMAFRLAQELPNRLAAIGAVVSNKPDPSECIEPGLSPIPVLIMNGTEDNLMPWNGGVAGKGGTVVSAEETRDLWVDFLGTETAPSIHIDFADVDPNDESTVRLDRYMNGVNDTEVEFYTVDGGGHTSPSQEYTETRRWVIRLEGVQNRDVEASSLIWEFFNRFTN